MTPLKRSENHQETRHGNGEVHGCNDRAKRHGRVILTKRDHLKNWAWARHNGAFANHSNKERRDGRGAEGCVMSMRNNRIQVTPRYPELSLPFSCGAITAKPARTKGARECTMVGLGWGG